MNQSENINNQQLDYTDIMNDELAKRKEATERAIKQAIANDPDKQPFDYKEFADLYWKADSDRDLTGEEAQELQDYYRKEYYLIFKDSKTIKAFVKAREELDSMAGN